MLPAKRKEKPKGRTRLGFHLPETLGATRIEFPCSSRPIEASKAMSILQLTLTAACLAWVSAREERIKLFLGRPWVWLEIKELGLRSGQSSFPLPFGTNFGYRSLNHGLSKPGILNNPAVLAECNDPQEFRLQGRLEGNPTHGLPSKPRNCVHSKIWFLSIKEGYNLLRKPGGVLPFYQKV